MTIALLTLGCLALVMAIIAVHDLTQRKHAVTQQFSGDRTFPILLRRIGATPAPILLRWRPRGAPVQPRHALMGVRLRKGAEQLRRFRITGGSQRTWADAHRAVNVPDAHACQHDRGRSSAPEDHRSQARSTLSAKTIREHRRYELRSALTKCGSGSLTRRQAGRGLHEHGRGLAVAVSRRGRMRHPVSDWAREVRLPHA